MLNYFNILLCYCIVIIFIFQVIKCRDNSSPPAFYCPNTTYTSNSTYSFNLKALLSSLASNSWRPNGFYNTTSGNTGSDIVYGIFLCRGDVAPDVCQNCVSTAVKDVTSESYCPNGKLVVLWVDECLYTLLISTFIWYRDEMWFFKYTKCQWTTKVLISSWKCHQWISSKCGCKWK